MIDPMIKAAVIHTVWHLYRRVWPADVTPTITLTPGRGEVQLTLALGGRTSTMITAQRPDLGWALDLDARIDAAIAQLRDVDAFRAAMGLHDG